MRCRGASGLLVLFSVLAAPASCLAVPQIKDIVPSGVRRGEPAELVISGADLGANPRLIAPFDSRAELQKGSDASSWKLKLTIAPHVAVGVYPVRVQTDNGISNPFLLAVGQLPQVVEREENSTFELAQSIPEPPLVVEGRVAGNDVDFFRFRGKKGQNILVDAQCARIGSGIDPTIRLTVANPRRTYVGSADDTPGLLTDARFTAVLPEDGDYIVEISDTRYQGAGRPVYRLLLGEVPMADEVYPLGGRDGETVGLELRGGTLRGLGLAAARVHPAPGADVFQPRITGGMIGEPAWTGRGLDLESLAPLTVSSYPELREPADGALAIVRSVAPVVFNGRIDPRGDEDRFALLVTPGSRLRIQVHAYDLGSALDAVLRIEGTGGSSIASADDTTVRLPPKNNQPQTLILPDPSLDLTVPSGTTQLTLVIRDLERRGGVGFPYRIVAEPLESDFELATNDSEVSVPRGGTATVGVTVKRRGYNGPITVTVDKPPPGLTVRPGTIAAGQVAGVLSLSAAPDARFPAAPVHLVGRSQGTSAPVERLASRPIVFAMQSTLPTSSTTEYGLVVAPAAEALVSIDAPADPVEVAHGFGATIPIKVVRTKGNDAALAVSALALPPGVTVPGDPIAAKASAATVRVQAAVEAPLGLSTLALQAKGKLAGADRVIGVPAVTLSVVRPASVELSTPRIELKPGATVELKGRLIRKGAFNEPVTVRLNGLPAGLKAEPVTIAPGATAMLLKLVADPKAAAATATAQVALAFQVNKKDYPVPAVPLSIKVSPAK